MIQPASQWALRGWRHLATLSMTLNTRKRRSATARATNRLLKLLLKDFFEKIKIAAILAISPKAARKVEK